MADQPGLTGRPRDDSIIAPVGFAHRTQMTDWSNITRAAISGVLPRSERHVVKSAHPAARLARPAQLPGLGRSSRHGAAGARAAGQPRSHRELAR